MDDRDEVSWSTSEDEGLVRWDIGEDEGLVRWDAGRGERRGVQRSSSPPEDSAQFIYCSNCGKRIRVNAEICPYCGVRVAPTQIHRKRSSLSFWAGVLVGFLALIPLSILLPILGPILAGLAAGVIAGGGAGRGASAGFSAGMIGFLVLAVVFAIGGVSIGAELGDLYGAFATWLGFLGALVSLLVGFFYSILSMIGGAIGGLLRN